MAMVLKTNRCALPDNIQVNIIKNREDKRVAPSVVNNRNRPFKDRSFMITVPRM